MLDGKHTVFGRVISGWDALDKLNRTHQYNKDLEETPLEGATVDRILTATVDRKRDHAYVPNRVEK